MIAAIIGSGDNICVPICRIGFDAPVNDDAEDLPVSSECIDRDIPLASIIDRGQDNTVIAQSYRRVEGRFRLGHWIVTHSPTS